MAKFFLKLAIVLLSVHFISCAPKRGKSKTHFDQKQTGDYNIRLNLKDFQIVAFIDNDSLGDLGSYDYDYDYSELTVKPGSVSTTTKATTTVSHTDNTSKYEEEQNGDVQEPLLHIKTSTLKATDDISTTTVSVITKKPIIEVVLATETKKPIVEVTTEVKKPIPDFDISISSEKPSSVLTSTKKTVAETSTASTTAFPDKIPVFIQSTAFLKDGLKDKKSDSPVTSVSIVPPEEISHSHPAPLGEIMYYRKCAQGYSRDKRGRCRKIRRPQFPFGIARIASDLASKFKSADAVEQDPTPLTDN